MLQRREAIQLFKEIYESSPCSFVFEGVLLRQDPDAFNRSHDCFELQITTILDVHLRKTIKTIVNRHHLVFQEKDGSFFIRSPRPKPMAILV